MKKQNLPMSNKLVFIGGPPGVGKSTVTGILFENLENAAWLEGDDVWKMNPFVVNDKTKSIVEKNVRYVLNTFIQAHIPYILFTWILHSDSIATSLLSGIDLSGYYFKHFTLTCDEKTLEARLSSDVGRKTDPVRALSRLNQVKSLSTEKIDTVDKSPIEIADILKLKIIS